MICKFYAIKCMLECNVLISIMKYALLVEIYEIPVVIPTSDHQSDVVGISLINTEA